MPLSMTAVIPLLLIPQTSPLLSVIRVFFFPPFSPSLLLKMPLMKAPPLFQIILVCNPILASRFLKIYEGLKLDSTVKRMVEDYP